MMLALVLALLVSVADTTRDRPSLPAPHSPDLERFDLRPSDRRPSDPGRQVITRAEIEAAGLYRLADLYRLIDAARTATVDGFTWRAHLGSGDAFGAEAWTLLVDGVRVDLGLFGEQNLGLLPVAITHVDSVEVWTVPHVAAGTFAARSIHLHTTRTAAATARGGAGLGNEIGDPGPYRYIPDRATRNVDKFGADYEALVATGDGPIRAHARFKLIRFYATDFASFDRNQEALLGGLPALRLGGGAVRAETDALGGTHALHLLGGGISDLWFFQPVGRELPTRRWWGQAALHGRLPLSSAAGITYRASFAENRLDERDETALGLDPQWRARTLRGGVTIDGQRGPLAATLGGDLAHTSADGADGFTLGTVIGTLAHSTNAGRQYLDAGLAAAGGRVAASGVLGARRMLRSGLVAGARVGAVQRLPEEDRRLSFWRTRGYAASDPILDVAQPEPPGTTTEAFASIDGSRRLPLLGGAFEASVTARRFSGLTIEAQPFAPDPDGLDVARPFVVVPDVEGTALRAHAAVRASRGSWRGRIFYDGQTDVGGDAAFRRAWEAVPTHRGGATAALALAPSFTVSSALSVRSGARWPGYAALDGAKGGLYADAVPALWLLDAAAEKWFWDRRVRTSLLFRNLLGVEERYHPVGAALDLRFYLRVELVLD